MASDSPEIFSVAQLTRRIKGLLERQLGMVWVSGEISNWKTAASGHAYFTLKDAESQVDAVMFKGRLTRVRFEPENGMEVLARGTVTVYERRGNYQLVIEEMQPRGLGALQAAFERLKNKLQAEGLFDKKHKKPLPLLPRRIGVVTSPTGAAIRDILHVIRRRFANVHVLLYPVRVQGVEAAGEIAAGIETLDRLGVDVMIVGRGGGSLEDLWPFNEERVARAIFAAKTPIISAVGHEIDFTLSDFVADLRAPTPSAAAELVVHEQQALLERVSQARLRLQRAMRHALERLRARMQRVQASYVLQRPETLLRQQRQCLDDSRMRLEQAARDFLRDRALRADRARHALSLLSPAQRLKLDRMRLDALCARMRASSRSVAERARNRWINAAARLNALSPMAVLTRGYALAWKLPERRLIYEASQLLPRDAMRILFGKGEVTATVTEIHLTTGMTQDEHREKT